MLTRTVAIASVLGVGAMTAYVAPQMTPDPRERFEHTLLGVVLERGIDHAALTPQLRREIGPKAYADLERVAELIEGPKADARALEDAAAAFNRDARSAGYPVLLLPVWPRVVSSVFVARRERVAVDGASIDAIWVRPLPSGPRSWVGWSDAERAAILSVNAFESIARDRLIPAIAGRSRIFHPPQASEEEAELDRVATAAIVEELLRASSLDRRAVEHFVAQPRHEGDVLARLTTLVGEVEMQRLGFAFLEAQLVRGGDRTRIPGAMDSSGPRLAAELALLAREQRLPRLALARALETLFVEPEGPGHFLPGRSIPLVVAELGRDPRKDYVANLLMLFKAPPADVRAAAARAYAKEFGIPLRPLTRTPIPSSGP